jgi:hypothetical protein
MFRGVARLRFKFALTMAAYDLIRLPKLLGAPREARPSIGNQETRSESQAIALNLPKCRISFPLTAVFNGLSKTLASAIYPP